MKKNLKIVIPIIVLALLGYMGYSIVGKMKQKNEIAKTLQTIPEFSFKTLNNQDFTNTNLLPNTPAIFVYFNSECDFCQHEAQSISENIEEFKDAQLLFVSTEQTETITEFAKTYNLHNQPNITFLNDSTHTFSTRFDASSIPYLLIYNKNKELVKKHKGQLKAETILKHIKN